MEFGLSLAPNVDRDTLFDEVRLAEDVGFSRVTSGEHLFFGSPSSSAIVTLAAAAAVSTRIRLLSSVMLVPLYPAALLVKLVESLDRVSGGRFELGVGVGGEYAPEFEAVGVPVSERGRRTDEALRLLSSAWTGKSVTHHGLSGSVVDQALDPAPTGPPPAIWMGGRKDSAMQRAARHADVWFPYMVTPEQFSTGISRVRELAEARGRDPRSIRGAVFLWTLTGDDDAATRDRAHAYVGGVYGQDFGRIGERYVLAGDDARVAARLEEFAAAGVERVVFALACPRSERSKQIAHLGERFVATAGTG